MSTDHYRAVHLDSLFIASSLHLHITLGSLYKMVHCKTILNIRPLKAGPQKCCSQTEMYRFYRKNDHFWSFFYIIYLFSF